jgi:hypothetical protein
MGQTPPTPQLGQTPPTPQSNWARLLRHHKAAAGQQQFAGMGRLPSYPGSHTSALAASACLICSWKPSYALAFSCW